MARIAVIGDRDSVLGYASLGLDIFPAEDPQQGAHTLRRLKQDGYAIVYVTEDLAAAIQEEIDRSRGDMLPAIIPIPGIRGGKGLGVKAIRKSVEQAVGSDILFGGDE